MADGAGVRYVRLGLEKLREPRPPEANPPPARAHAASGTAAAKSAATAASATTRINRLGMRSSFEEQTGSSETIPR
jgi:hypothetical protein